jgi:hypothetical protein
MVVDVGLTFDSLHLGQMNLKQAGVGLKHGQRLS